MTIKAKPTTRVRRDHPDRGERRNLYMTIGLGGAIAVSVLILVGAVLASWYGEHMTPMIGVNGTTVSKDFYRDAVVANGWSLDQQEAYIRERVTAGLLTATDGDQRISALQQQRQGVNDATVTAIEDGLLQTQLAAEKGITIGAPQVDAVLATRATTPEAREVWTVTAQSDLSQGATAPTQAQKDAAKAKAEAWLVDLKAGKSWDEVAKAAGLTGDKPGRGGYVFKGEQSGLPQTALDAVWALPAAGYSDVIETGEGQYTIVRVTDIRPASVDAAFLDKARSNGVNVDVVRTLAGYQAAQDLLKSAVLDPSMNQPSAQRDVSEIVLDAGAQGDGDAVKASHVLFSPNNDPAAAQQLDAADPAWAAAKAEAQAAYDAIKAGTTTFAAEAAKSDDASTAVDGGQLPWLYEGQLDPGFGKPLFDPTAKVGDLLPPVKSAYGWHVIRVDDRRPPADQFIAQLAQQAAAPGTDFAALARQYSMAKDATDGGALGWVAKYQLASALEKVIFEAPVGGLANTVQDSGRFYLYKVNKEEQRLPDAVQKTSIETNGFDAWYTPLKATAKIEELATPAAVLGTATPAP
jgi:parvulin-like peptidyl-prolyl isomerase